MPLLGLALLVRHVEATRHDTKLRRCIAAVGGPLFSQASVVSVNRRGSKLPVAWSKG